MLTGIQHARFVDGLRAVAFKLDEVRSYADAVGCVCVRTHCDAVAEAVERAARRLALERISPGVCEHVPGGAVSLHARD